MACDESEVTGDTWPLRTRVAQLASYGGTRLSTRVCAPENVDELRAALKSARRSQVRVTLRAGGRSFDTQSEVDPEFRTSA
jgi:FAD/FMN-containing dehydrogenase